MIDEDERLALVDEGGEMFKRPRPSGRIVVEHAHNLRDVFVGPARVSDEYRDVIARQDVADESSNRRGHRRAEQDALPVGTHASTQRTHGAFETHV